MLGVTSGMIDVPVAGPNPSASGKPTSALHVTPVTGWPTPISPFTPIVSRVALPASIDTVVRRWSPPIAAMNPVPAHPLHRSVASPAVSVNVPSRPAGAPPPGTQQSGGPAPPAPGGGGAGGATSGGEAEGAAP